MPGFIGDQRNVGDAVQLRQKRPKARVVVLAVVLGEWEQCTDRRSECTQLGHSHLRENAAIKSELPGGPGTFVERLEHAPRACQLQHS